MKLASLGGGSSRFSWWGSVQLIIGILAILSIPTAMVTYWTDSEIWAVSSASMLFKTPTEFAFGMKPFFNFVLYLCSRLPGLWPIDWARLFFGINAVLMVWLTARLAERLTGSKKAAIGAAAILVTCSFFTHHGQRVRSDLLATTMFLAHVFILFSPRLNLAAVFSSTLVLFASLTATPGSIYLLVAALPIYLTILKRLPTSSRLSLAVLVCAIFVGGAALMSVRNPDFLLGQGLLRAASFFAQTFGAAEFGFPYWHPMRFAYLGRFLIQNPVHAIALVASFGLFLKLEFRRRLLSESVWLWSWFSVGAFVLMALHPSKLPFFIASYMPFFSIFIAGLWSQLGTQLGDVARSRAFAIALVGFFALTWLTINRDFALYRSHDNLEQRQVAGAMGRALDPFPNILYYDVIGLVPHRDPLPYFVGPGQREANENTIRFILGAQPDVLVGVQKLTSIKPSLETLLREEYLSLPQGLFVKAAFLKPEKGARAVPSSALIEAVRKKFGFWFSGGLGVNVKFFDSENQELYAESSDPKHPGPELVGKITLSELARDHAYVPIPQGAETIVLTPFATLIPSSGSPMDVLFRFDTEL